MAEQRRGGTFADRWAGFLPVLVAVPAVVAAASVLVQGWTISSDQAYQVLRTADVGTARTPLLGAYSRWGWSHPGPLLFWVSAPGYRLAGPAGVPATTALVNAAALALAVVAARRLGGTLLASLTAVAGLLLALAMGDTIVDPWNPHAGVLPLLAYILCTWRAAEGDLAALVAAVVTGSYAVQAHVGFLPVVGATAAVASAVALWRWRHGALRPSPRVAGAVVVLGALLWSGPLIQQAVERGGNLRNLWDYTVSSDEPMAGWSIAVKASGRLFGVPAPWMGASATHPTGFALTASPQPMLATVAVVAALAVVAWRRGDRRAAGLAALVLGLVGVSVFAVSRVTGAVAPYLLEWAWPVAALLWVAGAWAAVRLAAGQPPPAGTPASANPSDEEPAAANPSGAAPLPTATPASANPGDGEPFAPNPAGAGSVQTRTASGNPGNEEPAAAAPSGAGPVLTETASGNPGSDGRAAGRLGQASGRRRAWRGDVTRVTRAIAVAASTGLAGVGAVSAATVTPPVQKDGEAVAALSAEVRTRLEPSETYGSLAIEPNRWGSVGTGVAVDLQRRGWDVRLARPFEAAVGEWRVTDDLEALPRIVVVERNNWEPWEPPPGARHVAGYDSLDAAERRRAATLMRRTAALAGDDPSLPELLSAVADANDGDPSWYQELQDARAYDVWLVPASS